MMIIVEEGGNAIIQFLTSPRLAQDPTRRHTNSTLTIDYSRLWLRVMSTLKYYMRKQRKRKEGEAEKERTRQKEDKDMERTKQKRQEEKVQLEADKRTRKGGNQRKNVMSF